MRVTSRMPTAAKLIGAVLFAALAWFVSEQIKDVLGRSAGLGLLSPINALLGAIMGWRVMGARAGDGFVASIGYGLTTVFAITFWAILVWSSYQMFNLAVRGRYTGPGDALGGLGDIMLENSALIVTPAVVGSAVIGGLVCGVVTEYFSHRWP